MGRFFNFFIILFLLLKPIGGFCINENAIEVFSTQQHHNTIDEENNIHDEAAKQCCVDIKVQDISVFNAINENKFSSDFSETFFFLPITDIICSFPLAHFICQDSSLPLEHISLLGNPLLDSFLTTVKLRL